MSGHIYAQNRLVGCWNGPGKCGCPIGRSLVTSEHRDGYWRITSDITAEQAAATQLARYITGKQPHTHEVRETRTYPVRMWLPKLFGRRRARREKP